MLTEKDFTKEQLAAGKALAYIEQVICFEDMLQPGRKHQ